MQQFPTACMWLYEVKISSQGLPGAFASCVVPEGFRDGVYAQGPSHGLQQSAAAECFGGGWDQWHCARLVARAQFPPQSRSCLQRLWNVTVVTTVRNLRANRKSGHPCFSHSVPLGSPMVFPCCCMALGNLAPRKRSLMMGNKFALQSLAFEGWRWGTNVFATVIAGQCLVLLLSSVSRGWKGWFV